MKCSRPFLLALLWAGGSCVGASGPDQLARVAKDWSLAVRASQIIPVYPLTEDLQPGDVFLVQTPVEEQVRLYEEKGFLPLDKLLKRIQPAGYSEFYGTAYGIGPQDSPPHNWQFPAKSPPDTLWDKSPGAGFPSYAFSVHAGAGASVAFPVHGIPVGLNLMGTRNASGTLSIVDAHTYGVPIFSLYKQLATWAAEPDSRSMLGHFAPSADAAGHVRFFYLRAVYRVFLVGSVNVSLSNDENVAAGVSGGAPKPVDFITPSGGDALANYTKALDGVGKAIDTALPGGSIKVAAASQRGVTLIETFPRPLVIGYLAFDAAILEGGQLGDLASTYATLSQVRLLRTASERIYSWLKEDSAREATLRDWLKARGEPEASLTPVLFETGADREHLRFQIVRHFAIP